MKLTFASRTSALARWQTAHVIKLLQVAHPNLECDERLITSSDLQMLERSALDISGRKFFAHQIEAALLSGKVHVVVHSLKDLPVQDMPGIVVAAIPARDAAQDVLVSANGQTLAGLPEGARVGTGGRRRSAQLLARRPDLSILPLNDAINVRVQKVLEGEYQAVVMAKAGLMRLGLEACISEVLPLEVMLPAPAQGALAVQCRAEDAETLELLTAIHDPSTAAAVCAERAFLSSLGGDCSLPVAAFAQKNNGTIILTGAVISVDGKQAIRLSAVDKEPQKLGQRLAELVLERGAADLLKTKVCT